MNSNKAKGFFYPGNAVSCEPDYGLAEAFDCSSDNFDETAMGSRTYFNITRHPIQK